MQGVFAGKVDVEYYHSTRSCIALPLVACRLSFQLSLLLPPPQLGLGPARAIGRLPGRRSRHPACNCSSSCVRYVIGRPVPPTTRGRATSEPDQRPGRMLADGGREGKSTSSSSEQPSRRAGGPTGPGGRPARSRGSRGSASDPDGDPGAAAIPAPVPTAGSDTPVTAPRLRQQSGHRLDGQRVAESRRTGDAPVGHRRDHRGVPEGLPGGRVGQVQLHHHALEGGQGVVERPRGVGQRPGIDDDGVGPAPGGVDRLDQLALVVGLRRARG